MGGETRWAEVKIVLKHFWNAKEKNEWNKINGLKEIRIVVEKP